MDVAVNYYSKIHDKKRLMRTGFLLARCRFLAGKYPESVAASLEPLDIATEVKDNYFIARLYELIADNHTRSKNYEQAYRMYLTAADYFRNTTKSDNAYYMQANAGKCLFSMGKYKEALTIYDNIIAATPDKALRSYVYESMIHPYLRLGRIEDAKLAYDSMYIWNPEWPYRNKHLAYYIAYSSGDTTSFCQETEKILADSTACELDMLYARYWMNYYFNRENEANAYLSRIHDLETDSLRSLCNRGIEINEIITRFQNAKVDKLEGRIGHYHIWIVLALSLIDITEPQRR
ncbi:MAG: hypothetical protein K2G60_00260, partial [Oscillospiraceae bacterium]|nr:hypothetical protein [Oscillospiraceae bacterium]